MRISLVAARRFPQDDLDRFIRSLPPDLEVILVDGVGDLTTLPGVRLLSLPGQPTPVLRAAGIAAAHGEAIALVDPACQLAPSWLAAARQALAQASLASGPVAYGGGRQLITWAAFLAEYGAFLPPSSARAGLAGTNLIVHRSALEQVGSAGEPFWKDVAVARWQAAGLTGQYVPALLVVHARPWRLLPFLRDRFQQGRCFAGRRRALLSPGERILRALAFPLVALVLGVRLARALWSKRHARWAALPAVPLVLLFLLAWAAGEAIGYLLGPGASCQQC
ncbi:MAG: glycosyltransferase family 2 protein [Chloroflexi bacterium]|nr:glycosyltransferase family 2 protein [Chloroflexota bacterium]GIW10770.1 MAG: hypothetical protein KatS3mg061_1827 [Dehalococcoidia bacterium]